MFLRAFGYPNWTFWNHLLLHTLSLFATLWIVAHQALHGLYVLVWFHPWQVQWHSPVWEEEACHQWKAHFHFLGARFCQYQMECHWYWVCYRVHWCPHYFQEGWGLHEGLAKRLIITVPSVDIPYLWQAWTISTAPSRWSEMPRALPPAWHTWSVSL